SRNACALAGNECGSTNKITSTIIFQIQTKLRRFSNDVCLRGRRRSDACAKSKILGQFNFVYAFTS
ncbi:MAG TPA: hypothetical protein PKY59_08615, partial [Pyrinomonadaceae bacterium]|nr:hypothetical protein [Pyrinomonadaceae bacterium]